MRDQATAAASTFLLHRCNSIGSPVTLGRKMRKLPCRTIDVHCHIFTPGVEELVRGHARKIAEVAAGVESLGTESAQINAAKMAELLPKLTSVEHRLSDMDAMGVDIQAISPSPTQYYTWAEPELAQCIADRQNDEIARLCKTTPSRFVGLGAVSLQHPELAAQQLEYLIRERGFKGVEVSTLADNLDIADRRFDPFWSKADELGAVVFIHPWGTTLGARLAQHYLMNTIGQPFETTVCLSKLIFGGTLDRHKKLKIIAAHGGGYLPNYIGRSDHARAVRAEVSHCVCRPSDYLKRIWFDSVVYETKSVQRMIDDVGASQIVLGTDYPFDMGHYDPATLLEELDSDDQRRIAGENAATLFGIV